MAFFTLVFMVLVPLMMVLLCKCLFSFWWSFNEFIFSFMEVLLSFHVDLGVHHFDCGDLGVCHFLTFHCGHCGGFCVCCLDCDDLGVHHFDFDDHGVVLILVVF